MHMRIGGDDDGTAEIGRTQSLVLGALEGEVDQPVIDEIDRSSLNQQFAVLILKQPTIGDRRFDAVPLKEALGQEKLWIEVCLSGRSSTMAISFGAPVLR
jgi:hypothetical protein